MVRLQVEDTALKVDELFLIEPVVGNFVPPNGGWTVYEILEHISLTSHFLLILIEKGTQKALKNIHNLDLETELAAYTFPKDTLEEVGIYQSFTWIRPKHMEPTGTADLAAVRTKIQEQFKRCLAILDLLKNGEGVLYKTTMTVNNLGKIDVYAYIYFLAKHAERHLEQVVRNINHHFDPAQ